MERPEPNPGSTPQDSAENEERISELTGMTRDAARTFLEFHSGMRWLRRGPDRDGA
jgi:hypothetical protein